MLLGMLGDDDKGIHHLAINKILGIRGVTCTYNISGEEFDKKFQDSSYMT